jgi:hypothetical protein
MQIKKNKIFVFLLILFHFFFCAINSVTKENLIGPYGVYYELVVFSILIFNSYFFGYLKKNYLLYLFVFFFIMLFFAKISSYKNDLSYLFFDTIMFSNFYFLLISLRKKLFDNSFLMFFIFSSIIILSNIILLSNSSFYDNDRFLGLMYNVNQNVYLVGFCLIYIHYFAQKFQNFRLTIIMVDIFLLLLSVLFLYYSYSRSCILIVLFFIVSILRLRYKSIFVILFLFIYSASFFSISINYLDFGRLFDPDDPSILTRINLQTDFIEGSANSFLMPHGPNSATIYVKNVTNRDEFHLHNDFLAYLFNYGFIFIAYLFLIIRILSSITKKSPLKNIIVFLFYFSSLFHGYLFSFFISIPLMFVLSLIINNDEIILIRTKRVSLT